MSIIVTSSAIVPDSAPVVNGILVVVASVVVDSCCFTLLEPQGLELALSVDRPFCARL